MENARRSAAQVTGVIVADEALRKRRCAAEKALIEAGPGGAQCAFGTNGTSVLFSKGCVQLAYR